jgi:hypothetical protein
MVPRAQIGGISPKRGFDFDKYSGLFFDGLARVFEVAACADERLHCTDMG